jgi:hypothetical protein
MTITLEVIEAKQSELSKLIESFKRQAEQTVIDVPSVSIALAAGEFYAGLILDGEGRPSYHLILLPGDVNGKSWADAKNWAAEQGGELPTRREQSLLFANLKQHFEQDWYWSNETNADYPAYAWFQGFSYGGQGNYRKDGSICRARAVRRLEIQ